MNYVAANPLDPCCSSCGDSGPVESFVLYRFELICPACKEEHDKASAAQDAEQFRWMSHEWFRLSHLERLPFMHRINFPARKAS